MKIDYQGSSLMGKSVLLIGGPKHGETFALQEPLETILLSIQDDIAWKDWNFDSIYAPVSTKTVCYSASNFYLDEMVVYRFQDLSTAELKFHMIQYQIDQGFVNKKPIVFFNMTEDEKWEIENKFKLNFKTPEPPKPKFVPGENCLFT